MSADRSDPTTDARDREATTPRVDASRRTVLRYGGLGTLGAVFLAACGTESGGEAGVSGTPTSSTAVPPTVPPSEPTETDLEADDVQFQTARTLELLVAEVYDTYGPRLREPDGRATAERFRADHADAAAEFASAAPQTEESGRPNEFLAENMVAPIANSLIDDRAILAFMETLESALTATYITAAGIFTSEEARQQIMSHGGASARRVTVLAGGGPDGAPTEALYPLEDLIPGEAYLLSPTDAALAEEADAEAAADEEG
ncbi:hypothetical protein BH23ACT2_BH23ACT2_08860 [soil metagenome]